QGLHRQRLIWCCIGMPITLPFALVPVYVPGKGPHPSRSHQCSPRRLFTVCLPPSPFLLTLSAHPRGSSVHLADCNPTESPIFRFSTCCTGRGLIGEPSPAGSTFNGCSTTSSCSTRPPKSSMNSMQVIARL